MLCNQIGLNFESITHTYFSTSQRYFAVILDCFADLNSNLVRLNKKNRLAFAIFTTIQSNGSLQICELVRRIAKDNWKVGNRLASQYGNCLWVFLVDIATESKFKAVGSCSQPRWQISNCGNIFDFETHYSCILSLFDTLQDCDSEASLLKKFQSVLDYIKRNIPSIGHVSGLKLLQLSALIGLLPLKVATFATVDTGGPSKLLRSIKSKAPPSKLFAALHCEFFKIWGGRFTRSYLENKLCELVRELQATIGSKKIFTNSDLKFLHMQMDGRFLKKGSPQKDLLTLWEHRGIENCIPNLYRLNVDTRGRVNLVVTSFKFNLASNEVAKVSTVDFHSFNEASIDALYILDN